jgi:putative hydrolase of the HAD superfamily
MQTIKAILFDLDDTLLDDELATAAALNDFHQEHEHSINLCHEEFADAWHHEEQVQFARFASGEISFQESTRERMRCFFGSEISDYQADSYFDSYVKTHESHWVLKAYALEMLELTKSYRRGVVTNGGEELQHKKLSALGIKDLFDSVTISGAVGVAKPSKEIFELALNRMGLLASEAIFIGDNLVNDAIGARDAGLRAVWFRHARDADKEVPENVAVVDSLEEFVMLLL